MSHGSARPHATEDTLSGAFGLVTKGVPSTVTASGDTIVHDPAAGKRVRLKWIWLSRKYILDANIVLVTIKIGTTAIYAIDMGSPSIFAHRFRREGAVDENVVVNCSAAPDGSSPIRVNLDLEEF